ncbi:MAG: hypothetical protein BHW12_00100 [Coprobacillus sp. 28_7]|nr:MAG: hypothetical protein BHW12_00100 [Coprobacillus sp. 28_7]
MLKEIDQKSIVKLYLCIMCIAILVVILLSCLFKKNNKEKKILFSSSICLLISINILEIIINYYKGYVTLGTYICYETSLLSKNKLIIASIILMLTLVAIIVGYEEEVIVFKKNIYNYNTFFFIRYILFYIYVIYQTIESIISKKEINNLIPIFVSVIIIMLALIQETSKKTPMINSFESMLTIIILIIFNFIYNKKELIK